MSSISAAHPQVGRVSGVEGKGEGLGPSEVPGMAPNSEVGLGTGGGDAELEGGLAEETGLNLGKPSLPGLSSPGISMGDPGFWPPAEPAAATLSSAQKATSHLSRRAPFRCDGLGWESIDRWRQRGVARRTVVARSETVSLVARRFLVWLQAVAVVWGEEGNGFVLAIAVRLMSTACRRGFVFCRLPSLELETTIHL